MKNILVRSLSGLVFVAMILLPLFFSKDIAQVIFFLFLLLSSIEFFKLTKRLNNVSISWEFATSLLVLSYALIASIFMHILPEKLLFFLPILVFLFFLVEIFRKKENPILNIAVFTFGWFYLIVPFSIISLMIVNDYNKFPFMVGMLLLIWTNDTFAFLVGKFFGKHKMISHISPKKTWEGTIGGFVFSFVVAYFIGEIIDPEHRLLWILSPVIISPTAVLGDLLESLLKRNAEVKDSGNLIPGHGGILDRLDAMILTVPFFFTWLLFYMYL